MNFYKTILPSKKIRLKMLKIFSVVPDSIMVRIQYFVKTGRFLRLKYPVRYTEKIQWYKLFYRDDQITRCSDKYEVRQYVREKGLEHILNDLFGVWHDAESVDLSSLPSSFILKATHGSGTNLIVNDMNHFDLDFQRVKINEWLKYDAAGVGREWGYRNIKPKIIAEKLLPRDSRGDLPDFKFFCFDGAVYCLYVMVDYADNHDEGKLAFYDRDFCPLNVFRKDFEPLKSHLEKPKNFKVMIEIAEKLSKGFPHVRVDLYNIDGAIFFGEMTFYNASGYTIFDPDSFDYELGSKFDINQTIGNNI